MRSAIASTEAAATASVAGVRLWTLTTIVPSSIVDVATASAPSSVNVSSIEPPRNDDPARWSNVQTAP